MQDLKLERQLADCRELAKLWDRFRQFIVLGIRGEEVTPEREEEFLELKSLIAILHDSFMGALTHDHAIGQAIITILSRSITLKHFKRLSVAELRTMEREWHSAYLLINEVIGTLEEKQASLEKVSFISFRSRQLVRTVLGGIHSFLTGVYFKLLLVAAALVFVIWGIPALDIYDYSNLKKYRYTQGLYKYYEKFARSVLGKEYPYETVDELRTYDMDEQMKTLSGRKVEKLDAIQMLAPAGEPVTGALLKSTDYRMEHMRLVDGEKFEIYFFLLSTLEEAQQLVEEFRAWAAGAPGKESEKYHLANTTWVLRKNNAVIFVRAIDQRYAEAVGEVYKAK